MLDPILLQAAAPVCGFASIDQNGWISINVLVVLASVMIAAIVFVFANFLPPEWMQKLKGISRYEMVEAIVSIAIIGVLLGFSTFACNSGASLVGSKGYTTLFAADTTYVSHLLFLNGAGIVESVYTSSIRLMVAANIFNYVAPLLAEKYLSRSSAFPVGTATINVSTTVSPNFNDYFYKLSGVLTGAMSSFVIITYSILFLLFLLLPVISAGALTVLAPLSLVVRSLSFAGKKLREVSNQLLAIAIGFYFVLPLMLALNSYVGACLNTGLAGTAVACNYPSSITHYLSNYALPVAPASLFTSSNPLDLSSNAMVNNFVAGFGGTGILRSFYGPAFSNIDTFFSTILYYPGVAQGYALQISGYMFLGIVMIALDFAVTLGFVVGIAKGLNALSGNELFGSEPIL